MARGSEPAPLLLLGLLAVVTHFCAAQMSNCTCPTNKMTVCSLDGPGGHCQCRAIGSQMIVDCTTLTSKCLLLKARMSAGKSGRSLVKPSEHAVLDNDGLYDPECDHEGRFKARQCNQTSVCWCVNSVGVRRTDKGDLSLRCDEVVRTHHILIELRHRRTDRAFNHSDLDSELRRLFKERYQLRPHFLTAVHYEEPIIQIELRQNASQKGPRDVDIADVAYYFERDIKGESLFSGRRRLDVQVKSEAITDRQAVGKKPASHEGSCLALKREGAANEQRCKETLTLKHAKPAALSSAKARAKTAFFRVLCGAFVQCY
ncbi:tumor-associated calcium signal transducer 2 isoform X2 [Onychomys torridus]|uniref:tumor-associated calcium signal transducer 2 isoform X2 n=1 Tax=Onychomys torridus TaxID=38674 RepID=UPI00167F431F|nr:tumor-associated calcium signal transducer 2 isoform X2 [Onychomys torridus]